MCHLMDLVLSAAILITIGTQKPNSCCCSQKPPPLLVSLRRCVASTFSVGHANGTSPKLSLMYMRNALQMASLLSLEAINFHLNILIPGIDTDPGPAEGRVHPGSVV